MTPILFFYGTLLDPAVRRRVLGRTLSPRTQRPALLFDYTREHVAGRPYPMLVAHPGAVVDGVVARGLTTRDLARLDAYEGSEYRLAPLAVLSGGRRVIAMAYMAAPGILSDGREWTRTVRGARGFNG